MKRQEEVRTKRQGRTRRHSEETGGWWQPGERKVAGGSEKEVQVCEQTSAAARGRKRTAGECFPEAAVSCIPNPVSGKEWQEVPRKEGRRQREWQGYV